MGRRSILVMDDFGPGPAAYTHTHSLAEWCESVYNVAARCILCAVDTTLERERVHSPDKKGVRAASGAVRWLYNNAQNVRRAHSPPNVRGCSNAAINPSWWSFNQLASFGTRAFARSIELH